VYCHKFTSFFNFPAFPSVVCGMPCLSYLNLGENKMKGTIPPAISILTALQTLNVWQNKLSGGLEHLRGLQGLDALTASCNDFSGKPHGGCRRSATFYCYFMCSSPLQVQSLANWGSWQT
jgi:hypothetical protein